MRNRWTTTSGTARRALCLAGGGVLLSLGLPSSLALADHRGSTCETQANDTYEELLECVTREGVRNHQEELQEIADENDDPFYPGTRAAGTEGYARNGPGGARIDRLRGGAPRRGPHRPQRPRRTARGEIPTTS